MPHKKEKKTVQFSFKHFMYNFSGVRKASIRQFEIYYALSSDRRE